MCRVLESQCNEPPLSLVVKSPDLAQRQPGSILSQVTNHIQMRVPVGHQVGSRTSSGFLTVPEHHDSWNS